MTPDYFYIQLLKNSQSKVSLKFAPIEIISNQPDVVNYFWEKVCTENISLISNKYKKTKDELNHESIV